MTLQLLNYWQCDRSKETATAVVLSHGTILILIAVKSYAVTIQMKPLLFGST